MKNKLVKSSLQILNFLDLKKNSELEKNKAHGKGRKKE